jgi:hypothetical protein
MCLRTEVHSSGDFVGGTVLQLLRTNTMKMLRLALFAV